MTRYVLYCPEWGVYLGSFAGLGFWSGMDPAGRGLARVFGSPEEALALPDRWLTKPPDPRAVEVECADAGGATVAECVDAGLPGWDSETGEEGGAP